jgi:hypothetical protein
VDEFVIAIGKGDEDDHTRELVESIGDSRIKIIDTVWEDREKLKGKIHGQQTNIALQKCTGDWCFYVQADEVVHEDDLPIIKSRCEQLLDDKRVEGLLFDYIHFWGDYNHYHAGHGWYKKEIRIVRNGIGIKSWSSAQSFRTAEERKLTVARANARIFHYGWVRPPELMQTKNKEMATTHHGKDYVNDKYARVADEFDYGPLGNLAVFKGTHPAIMKERIAMFNWGDKLRQKDPPGARRELRKDERFKYRFLTAIERWTGLDLGHKNYRRILKGNS